MQPVKTKKKLSRADKKQIEAAIARANRTDKKGKSAQDSIPYERMWPDGICRISDSHYTKTIQFQDINYQLSQNEDKTAIFEGWCDFLNYFDSSIHFQLSFLNLAASEETFANSISIPPQRDAFDSIREEYTTMLQNQLARGNNGLIKTKYLTFGIDADSIKAAKPRLERIETDILNNFKRLGVAARTLDGKERLFQLHAVFHMDEQLPFQFEWDWLAPSGLSTKDFIAPSSFEFRTGKQFRMGKKYGAVSFLQILAPELNDRLLADFLDMESSLIVSMHIQSVDQVKAIKTVKRKITDLDRSKIEEQKKAVRAGYDMDIIPSDLATYGSEAKKLLQDLQSRNERMFLLTFLVLNTADNPRQLGNNIFQAGSIAQKYNCQLTRLDFQQEEGLMSCLPLGINQIEIQRGLTTSSTAIFVPFTTQETMAVLTDQEQTAACLLLSALIGFLAAEAPMDEQSFPMVMELLNCMEGEKEDGCRDAVDILFEDTVSNTHRHEEYYSNYQRYQLMQVYKPRIILACRIIINDLLGKLYRYDYRFGYNLLLDEENSIEKKLHTPVQEEWEDEDYETCNC